LLATLAVTLTAAFVGMFLLWRQAENERDLAVKAGDEKEKQRLLAVKNEKEAVSQRDRADKNLQQAFKAGEVLLTRVSEERLLKEPRMEGVRRDLLLKAVQFYE